MNSKKLKGFTLIEMVIVITIITILAGVLSLAIRGFRRDAKVETDQKMAQMVFTGFQNILIQHEISQDAGWFNCNSGVYDDSDIKAVEVVFHVARQADNLNDLGAIKVKTYVTGGSSSTTYVRSNTNVLYVAAKNEIMGNLDASFQGTVAVFINYEDYTVDSVVYRELNADGTDPTVDYTNLSPYNGNVSGYRYYGAHNYNEILDLVKNKNIYYGAYPFSDNLS